MRAQDFAEKCANIFLIGLPMVLFGMPVLIFVAVNFAEGAAPIVRPALTVIAYLGYFGIPLVGLAGACVGIWCYFKKAYQHKLRKQILVIVVLVIYVWAATIATQAYQSMRHKAKINESLQSQGATAMTSSLSLKSLSATR